MRGPEERQPGSKHSIRRPYNSLLWVIPESPMQRTVTIRSNKNYNSPRSRFRNRKRAPGPKSNSVVPHL